MVKLANGHAIRPCVSAMALDDQPGHQDDTERTCASMPMPTKKRRARLPHAASSIEHVFARPICARDQVEQKPLNEIPVVDSIHQPAADPGNRILGRLCSNETP